VQSAQAFVPQGYVAGAVYRTDPATMTGSLALFRLGSDDPKTPGSDFDWGHTLFVKLTGERGAHTALHNNIVGKVLRVSVDDGPHFASKAIVTVLHPHPPHCRSDLLSTLVRGIFGDHPPSLKRWTAGRWHQGHDAVADVFR
jgi:hypothetical protein